jgi:hypothetical protein
VFDRLVATADAAGDLVVLSTGIGGDDAAAYAAANEAIIRQGWRALSDRGGYGR